MEATGYGTRHDDAEPAAASSLAARVPGAARLAAATAPRPAVQGLLALGLYLVAFVLAAGLPLARHLALPNLRQYWTDVQFYAWALDWWPYALSHGVNPLFSAQIGAPHGYDLAWASTAPLVDVVMWPVTAAFGPLVSYNIVLLAVPPLSAWAMFAAARRLTGAFWPSLLAGAVYGFCPFELTHNWQGQPNLTVTAFFPLLVYLVVRWWEGSLGRYWFVAWMTLALAAQFYTFNEGFAELTMALGIGLVAGLALAGRGRRAQVARLAGLTAVAYAGAIALAAPYLAYSLRHFQGATLTRQEPAYSLPLIRLIVPTSEQMFGAGPLVGYSDRIGRGGIEDYVGIPLLVLLLALAVVAWRSRLARLLVIGFVAAIALAVGPNLVVTSVRHTRRLPWAGVWDLPFARSAEPSRFIVFCVLVLALALALWLARPAAGRARLAARWGLALLAVAAVLTDTPTSYQAVTPLPAGTATPAGMHPVNQLPPFITQGLYRRYLRPGESVVVLTHRGNAGMLFQAASGFYFRIAGGYINASLTPVNALPHPVTLLAHPSKEALGLFAGYARSTGLGAIVVEQAWAEPWMRNLGALGLHGTSAGGVTVYPLAPWLTSLARVAGKSREAGKSSAAGRSREAGK